MLTVIGETEGGNHTLRWDRVLPAGSRFEVLEELGGEAVRDNETGLVWEQSPPTTPRLWSSARTSCPDRTIGGRKGWRLPSIHVLASLMDPSVPLPGLLLPSPNPFTDVQAAGHWSATTLAFEPDLAWLASFGVDLVGLDLKSKSYHAWCVRGGINSDQY